MKILTFGSCNNPIVVGSRKRAERAAAMQETRKTDRYLTLRTGKISFPGAPNGMDCAVLNVSRTGACLLVPANAAVPDQFDLTIDHERAVRSCRRVWHDGSRIGLEFLAVPTPKKV